MDKDNLFGKRLAFTDLDSSNMISKNIPIDNRNPFLYRSGSLERNVKRTIDNSKESGEETEVSSDLIRSDDEEQEKLKSESLMSHPSSKKSDHRS